MKKTVLFIALMLIFSGCTSSFGADEIRSTPTANVAESPYLDMESLFPDEEFREEVLDELARIFDRKKDFTQEDLNGVTEIGCYGSVEGIKNLCNLKKLYVYCDITAGQEELGQLESLSKIHIYKTVTHLEPLTDINNAQTWYVSSFSQIEDISIVSTLSNVEALDIDMDIFDWDIIKLFPNLKKISLYYVEVEDCDTILALKDSPTLEVLKFEDAWIDLGVLSALNNVKVLEMKYPVYATNCASIDGFENLEILDFPEPDFGLDIKGLENIPNLRQINFECAHLENIKTISKITNLETLDLTFCYLGQDGEYEKDLENIGFLGGLINLKNLTLHDNEISDIDVLGNLTNLMCLYIKDNNISDISALENLTMLTDLNIEENFIEDITPLSNLTELTELNISENSISDISALSNLTNLVELDISENNITDLTPLLGLPNLKILDVSNNPIEDYSVLDQLDLDELYK